MPFLLSLSLSLSLCSFPLGRPERERETYVIQALQLRKSLNNCSIIQKFSIFLAPFCSPFLSLLISFLLKKMTKRVTHVTRLYYYNYYNYNTIIIINRAVFLHLMHERFKRAQTYILTSWRLVVTIHTI